MSGKEKFEQKSSLTNVDVDNVAQNISTGAHTTINVAKTGVKTTYNVSKATYKVGKTVVNALKDDITKTAKPTDPLKEFAAKKEKQKPVNPLKSQAKSKIAVIPGKRAQNVTTFKKRLKKSSVNKMGKRAVAHQVSSLKESQFEDADTDAKVGMQLVDKSAYYGKKGYRTAVKAGYKGGKWALVKGAKKLAGVAKDIPFVGSIISRASNVVSVVVKALQFIVAQIISLVTTALGLLLPIILVFALILSFVSIFFHMEQSRSVGDLEGVEREVALALFDLGFSKAAVAGVLANIRAESNFVYNVQEDLSGKWNPYEINYGLFQFTDAGKSRYNLDNTDELTRFKRWCAKRGVPIDSIKSQIDFQFADSGGYGIAAKFRQGKYNVYRYKPYNTWKFSYIDDYQKFKQMDDPGHAAYVFMIAGETPEPSASHLSRRVKYAREYFRRMGEGEIIAVPTGDRGKVLSAAYFQLGVRYVWGGYSPGVCFDCSGFTKYCYSKVGVNLPHSASQQRKMLRAVPRDKIQPGDLIFWIGNVPSSASGNHVAIYIGGGKIIHANGSLVTISNLRGNWTSAATCF